MGYTNSMRILNKVFDISIYSVMLSLAVKNYDFFWLSIYVFVTTIILKALFAVYKNRILPVEGVVPEKVKEQDKQVLSQEISAIEKEMQLQQQLQRFQARLQEQVSKRIQENVDSEYVEQKQRLVSKAVDNGYRIIKEEIIPENLKF